MSKPLTSEEKLLNIIRKKKVVPEPEKKAAADAKKEKVIGSNFGQGKLQGHSLKIVNRILATGVPVLIVILGVQYSVSKKELESKFQNQIAQSTKDEKKAADKNALPQEVKPVDVYLSHFQERDIFMAPWEKPAAADGLNTSLAPLSEEIRVTGIILDSDPKAIIEDIKTEQTSFLSRGDSIKNAKIIDIKEDRVIFEYNNSQVELVP